MELAKLLCVEYKKHHFVLADCPFCGGKAKMMGTTEMQGLISYFVKCSICDATSDFSPEPAGAVRKWNKRA